MKTAFPTLLMALTVAVGCNAPEQLVQRADPAAGSETDGGAETGDLPADPVVHVSGWSAAALPPPPAEAPMGPGTTAHDIVTSRFTGSDRCGFCHDGITDGAGNDVSIRQAWAPGRVTWAGRRAARWRCG